MKGTYRRVEKAAKPNGKTSFDDWSDPLLLRCVQNKTTNKHLTEPEKIARLDKFKTKTAYCQTIDETDHIRLKVKQGEPLIHHKEIRQLRLPLYCGLVLNLEDEGYTRTSEYIKELIVLDEMYSKHDPIRCLLRSNKTVLDKLANDLKLVEDAKREENTNGEVQALMDLAIYFMNSESSFYWIAEELMDKSIILLTDTQHPVDPKVEATLRYIYSKFLLDIAHDFVKAKLQIDMSMKLSIGKSFWTINVDGKRDELLYLRSCVLLSKINLEEAHDKKNMDIQKAIQSCKHSLYWAKQANNKPTIASILLKLAKLYLHAKEIPPVFDLLQEHIKLCKTSMFNRELCEGYIMLSKYYETVGNHEKVVEVIEELISFALGQGILDVVMKAHLKLAEFYAVRRMAEKINKHAAAAFEYCKLAKKKEEIRVARCLLGVAMGDQLLSDYINLVLLSDHLESNHLKQLIDWKMQRAQFSEDDKTISYQPEIENILRITKQLNEIKTEEIAERAEKVSESTRTSYRSRFSSGLPWADPTSSLLKIKQSNVEFKASSLLSVSVLQRVPKLVSFMAH